MHAFSSPAPSSSCLLWREIKGHHWQIARRVQTKILHLRLKSVSCPAPLAHVRVWERDYAENQSEISLYTPCTSVYCYGSSAYIRILLRTVDSLAQIIHAKRTTVYLRLLIYRLTTSYHNYTLYQTSRRMCARKSRN